MVGVVEDEDGHVPAVEVSEQIPWRLGGEPFGRGDCHVVAVGDPGGLEHRPQAGFLHYQDRVVGPGGRHVGGDLAGTQRDGPQAVRIVRFVQFAAGLAVHAGDRAVLPLVGRDQGLLAVAGGEALAGQQLEE